uniref:Uncharacterized protein n=1 Tax=Acrobeloides nanus TaxID=290746 RepID=A0A914CSH2_9BILA
MDERSDGRTNERMDERADERTNERASEQADERVDERINKNEDSIVYLVQVIEIVGPIWRKYEADESYPSNLNLPSLPKIMAHLNGIKGQLSERLHLRIEELNELEKNNWKTSEKVKSSTEAQQVENTLQERSQEKSKQLILNLKQENEHLKEMMDVLQTTMLDGGGIKDKRVVELEKVNQALQKQNDDLDQKIESLTTEYRKNLDDKEICIQDLVAKLALSEQNSLELIESMKTKELRAQNLQATLETTVNERDELNRKLTSENSAKEAEVQNLSSQLSSAEQNISSLIKTLKEQKTIAEKFKHDLQKAVMERDGMAQQLVIEQTEKKQKLESLKNEWNNVTRKNYSYLSSCIGKCFQESLAARDLGFLERETNNDTPTFNNYHELFAVPESVSSSMTSFDVLGDLEGSQGVEENVQDD